MNIGNFQYSYSNITIFSNHFQKYSSIENFQYSNISQPLGNITILVLGVKVICQLIFYKNSEFISSTRYIGILEITRITIFQYFLWKYLNLEIFQCPNIPIFPLEILEYWNFPWLQYSNVSIFPLEILQFSRISIFQYHL